MKKSDEARQRIMNATIELLSKQGGATVKEISTLSNVNVAAINYYFGDKQSLYNKVILYVIDDLKEKIERRLDHPSSDLKKDVSDIINDIYDWTHQYIGVLQYLMTTRKVGNKDDILLNILLFDKLFTQKIFDVLEELTGIKDKETLYIKYLVIFSSIAFPMMIEVTVTPEILEGNGSNTSLSKESFKKKYIDELIKVILG